MAVAPVPVAEGLEVGTDLEEAAESLEVGAAVEDLKLDSGADSEGLAD